MKKQNQPSGMFKKPLPNLFLLFALVTTIFFSCKKQPNEQSSSSPQIEVFLKLPANTQPELRIITDDLRKELNENNFVKDFVNWHGQPLWGNAIKVKTSDDNFSFYIPTKKETENTIATFFIAQYNKGHFYYEMHRRRSLNFKIKENSRFNYSQKDYAKILAYFDHEVLNRKDTLFLNNTIDGLYADNPVNGSNNINKFYNETGSDSTISSIVRALCWWTTVEVPCENVTASVAVPHNHCYIDVQNCIYVEDGGGTGDGGSGTGGGTGGGGGGTGGGEEPCPSSSAEPWYSNNIVPDCGDGFLDDFSYPGGICYIENGNAGPGITQHTRTHILKGEVKNGFGGGGHSQNALGITIRWQAGTTPVNGPNNMKKGKLM